MPEQATIERARKDKREGKSPSTQAGEFVREEFHHIREGKHGARSPQQAIAIGLSKARRAGVKLRPPSRGRFSDTVRRQAERDYKKGQHGNGHVSRRRSRATLEALKHEGRGADKNVALKKFMIRKLKSGGYRLYSRKTNPATGKRRNLGTFDSMAAAHRHERQVQFFKHH